MTDIVTDYGTCDTYVLGYRAENNICTSVGTLVFQIPTVANGTSFIDQVAIGSTVRQYQNGTLRGTYRVDSVITDVPASTITVNCVNNCWKLKDYYVVDTYPINGPTYSAPFITQFASEAGVSITYDNVDGSTGVYISNNTTLGLNSAYDLILGLLQQNAWYLYFAADGTAHVGRLFVDLSNPTNNITSTHILQASTTKNDKMLRNKANVWGNANVFGTGQIQYVFASLKIQTPWNYDSKDIRTIVIANSDIVDIYTANRISKIVLDTFRYLTYEKRFDVPYDQYIIDLGNVEFFNSPVYTGTGMVTSYSTEVHGNSGGITSIVCDEKCASYVGYYDLGGPIYIGTEGSGVWKKPIKYTGVGTWTNYSTGITDLNIKDLTINAGNLAAVSSGGTLYTRDVSQSSWISNTSTTPSGVYVACDYSEDNKLFALSTITGAVIPMSGIYIWTTITPAGWLDVLDNGTKTTSQIILSGESRWYGIDVDSYNNTPYVSVYGDGTGNPTGGNPFTTIGSGIYSSNSTGENNIRDTSAVRKNGEMVAAINYNYTTWVPHYNFQLYWWDRETYPTTREVYITSIVSPASYPLLLGNAGTIGISDDHDSIYFTVVGDGSYATFDRYQYYIPTSTLTKVNTGVTNPDKVYLDKMFYFTGGYYTNVNEPTLTHYTLPGSLDSSLLSGGSVIGDWYIKVIAGDLLSHHPGGPDIYYATIDWQIYKYNYVTGEHFYSSLYHYATSQQITIESHDAGLQSTEWWKASSPIVNTDILGGGNLARVSVQMTYDTSIAHWDGSSWTKQHYDFSYLCHDDGTVEVAYNPGSSVFVYPPGGSSPIVENIHTSKIVNMYAWPGIGTGRPAALNASNGTIVSEKTGWSIVPYVDVYDNTISTVDVTYSGSQYYLRPQRIHNPGEITQTIETFANVSTGIGLNNFAGYFIGGEENMVWCKINDTSAVNAQGNYLFWWKFGTYEQYLGAIGNTSPGSYHIFKYTTSGWEDVLTTTYPVHFNSGGDRLLITYGGMLGNMQDSYDGKTFIYDKFNNPSGIITDARPYNYITATGYLPSITYAEVSGLKLYDLSTGLDKDILYTSSGNTTIEHLEVTQNQLEDHPYLFYSTYDPTQTRISRFYQRDGYNYGESSITNEYSSTLPNSRITIIKLDNRQ